MSTHNRYISKQIKKDLGKKMVFIGGARQVGKTTMSQALLSDKHGYLNWDIAKDREQLLKHQLPNAPLWVFDEIHKYLQWRDYIKGVFDEYRDQKQILVTGSARLDYYRRGGDSLQGRYYYLRLHQLSAAELDMTTTDQLHELFTLGGFPEPFFSSSKVDAKRWSRAYRQRLLQEDVGSLEQVKDIYQLELLMLRLPELVGSPLSINNLREDLQVSHKAVSHWLDIFERLYAIHRVAPFGSPILRAVKKEQKHYHFDWTLLEDQGARFENMIAMHLLKWVHYEQDTQARDIELNYFRDVDGREVDFIITENGQPIHAIECKLSDADTSKSLLYFKQRFPDCEAWQLSMGDKDFLHHGIAVCPAVKFLQRLV